MKKVYKIVPVILILAIGALSIRLFVVLTPKRSENADTSQGVEYVQQIETVNVQKAEEEVRKAREKNSGKENRKKILKALEDGNFELACKDILISGDSIVKSIMEYGILSTSHVMAEIGAGTEYLDDISKDIIAANPKYLILHFGENQVVSEEHAAVFADAYGEIIKQLKKKLPNTKIYVDSIFPVLEKAYGSEPYLVHIPAYNAEIKKMAKEIGVTYLDYDELWASISPDYYDMDGIHPVSKFYTEQYLPFVLAEVGYKIDE